MIEEKNRNYGRTREISIEELCQKFRDKRLDYVKIALLFGSRAKGEAKLQSDYDFALLVDEKADEGWGAIARAWVDVGSVLGLSDYDFDIVDLSKAPQAMIESIRQGFVILKGEKDDIWRILKEHEKDSR